MTKRHDQPLTPEQLENYPDSEIDYSDIPELDAEFWDNATITPPRKKQDKS